MHIKYSLQNIYIQINTFSLVTIASDYILIPMLYLLMTSLDIVFGLGISKCLHWYIFVFIQDRFDFREQSNFTWNYVCYMYAFNLSKMVFGQKHQGSKDHCHKQLMNKPYRLLSTMNPKNIWKTGSMYTCLSHHKMIYRIN